LKAELFYTLCKLVEMGVHSGNVPVTTRRIAKSIGTSQQTASRRLMELEKNGLIRRVRILGGEGVQLTPEGKRELNVAYLTLKRVLEPLPKELVLQGGLFSGLGEGAYYIHQPGYRKQFIKKLGYDPFPGTLNIRLDKRFIPEKTLLETMPFILIEGFSNGKRSYGPVRCYSVSVNGVARANIITALRSHYGEEILEIIASVNLREKLKLKDGDTVTVKVYPSSR
jgi:riboflavin kinase